MLLGLLPKGNLLAVAIGMAVFATRVSLPVCMLAALVFSLLSGLLDPLTGRLGHSLLTYGPLIPFWERFDRLPLAAWTAFNNTVVLGNLVLGTSLFLPVYRAVLPWMTRYRQYVLGRSAVERSHAQPEPQVDSQPAANLPALNLPAEPPETALSLAVTDVTPVVPSKQVSTPPHAETPDAETPGGGMLDSQQPGLPADDDLSTTVPMAPRRTATEQRRQSA